MATGRDALFYRDEPLQSRHGRAISLRGGARSKNDQECEEFHWKERIPVIDFNAKHLVEHHAMPPDC
jgi:hypothetical protein